MIGLAGTILVTVTQIAGPEWVQDPSAPPGAGWRLARSGLHPQCPDCSSQGKVFLAQNGRVKEPIAA